MVLPSHHDLLALSFNRKKKKMTTKKKKHEPPLMNPTAAAAAITRDNENIDPLEPFHRSSSSSLSSKRVVTTKKTTTILNSNDPLVSPLAKKLDPSQKTTFAAAATSRDGTLLNSNHPLASSSKRVAVTTMSNLNSKNPMVDRRVVNNKRMKEPPVLMMQSIVTAAATRRRDDGIIKRKGERRRCVTPPTVLHHHFDSNAAAATNESFAISRNGTTKFINSNNNPPAAAHYSSLSKKRVTTTTTTTRKNLKSGGLNSNAALVPVDPATRDNNSEVRDGIKSNDPLVSVHRLKVAKKENELPMIQTTAVIAATRHDGGGTKRDDDKDERRCVTPVFCSSDDSVVATNKNKNVGSNAYRISVGRYAHEQSEGQSSSTTWTMRDFIDCNNYLGSGKFGEVDLYQLRDESKTKVALKLVNRKQCDKDRWCLIEREIYIQTRLSHAHICRCLGYFTTRSSIQVVLEYAPFGDLNFARSRRIPHKLVIRQVASALVYLHERNVAHRDVKMENVLVFSNNCVKLADFGWAIHLGSESHFRSTLCGTPACLPPEMLLDASYNALLVDSWALGILAHELVLDKSVFVGNDRDEILDKVKQFRYLHFTSPKGNNVDNATLYDLLSNLICHSGNRWTARQALQHEWLSNGTKKRGSKQGITAHRRRRRRW